MRSSIKDVARLAGVSPATVSYVINRVDSVKISEGTRKRVVDAARKLGYQPNPAARSLKGKGTRTIGLVIPDVINPFFPELIRGVQDVADSLEFNILLCNSDDEVAKEVRYFKMLRGRGIDGIMFSGVDRPNEEEKEMVERLLQEGFPVVMVDRALEGVDACSVTIDNFKGGYLGTAHLVELGHKRIGIITGPIKLRTNRERVLGYRKALEDNGLSYDELLIRECHYKSGGAYHSMKELLAMKDPPTAVFALGDFLAMGAMAALKEEDLQIPQDIALMGFDDIMLSQVTDPPLTTISQPKYDIGALGARMLIDIIERRTVEKRHLVLSPSLVIRRSTTLGGDRGWRLPNLDRSTSSPSSLLST